MADSNTILKPVPKHGWQITPASSNPSRPPSPPQEPDSTDADKSNKTSPSRTRSVLNLTSSTLFGIYAPNGPDSVTEISQVNTPWGNGSMTPSIPASPSSSSLDAKRSPSIGTFERSDLRQEARHHPARKPLSATAILPLILRIILLFLSGMAYGTIVSYLHENKALTPVKIEGIQHHTWAYLIYWGLAGVAMGTILPGLDFFFFEDQSTNKQRPSKPSSRRERKPRDSVVESEEVNDNVEWFPNVRGVGAFIGIAYAIHHLPWESTLQALLTLALINPVLWYIVDRTRAGFTISVLTSLVGSALFMTINSHIVPPLPDVSGLGLSPDATHPSTVIASDFSGVSVWIASVIFCSCVCFRSIGKSLALWGEGSW